MFLTHILSNRELLYLMKFSWQKQHEEKMNKIWLSGTVIIENKNK